MDTRLLVSCVFLLLLASAIPVAGVVRMNHYRMVSTHNSYHIPPETDTIPQWSRQMPSLTTQMSCTQTRKLELDFYPDDPDWKVQHIRVYDANSNCANLSSCFQEIASYSQDHPDHLPIYIYVEAKEDPTVEQWATFDELVRSVFGVDNLFEPDALKGSAGSIRAALVTNGWPELDTMRGKIVVVLNSVYTNYLVGNTLAGRAAFVDCDYDTRSSSYCAFLSVGDPTGNGASQINQAVTEGFIVKTRADSGYIPGFYSTPQLHAATFYMVDVNDNERLTAIEISNFFSIAAGINLDLDQMAQLQAGISICSNGASFVNITQYPCLVDAAAIVDLNIDGLLASIMSESQAITQRTAALGTNAHFIDTDYPWPATGDDYSVYFINRKWVECLDAFIAAGCTSESLAETTPVCNATALGSDTGYYSSTSGAPLLDSFWYRLL